MDTTNSFDASLFEHMEWSYSEKNTEITQEGFESYVENLSKCEYCKEEGEILNYLTGKESSGIKVLIVWDRALKDDEKSERILLMKKILTAMGLKNDDYAMTSFLKYDSLLPSQDEKKHALEHIKKEVSLLKPKFIFMLGALVTEGIWEKNKRPSVHHGEFVENLFDSGCISVPLFHPEYLLINPLMKRTMWDDVQKVMKYLAK